MITDRELTTLLKAVARVTKDFFAQRTAPIVDRLAELERSHRALELKIRELQEARQR